MCFTKNKSHTHQSCNQLILQFSELYQGVPVCTKHSCSSVRFPESFISLFKKQPIATGPFQRCGFLPSYNMKPAMTPTTTSRCLCSNSQNMNPQYSDVNLCLFHRSAQGGKQRLAGHNRRGREAEPFTGHIVNLIFFLTIWEPCQSVIRWDIEVRHLQLIAHSACCSLSCAPTYLHLHTELPVDQHTALKVSQSSSFQLATH